MKSQFSLDLSDPTCMKPNIHAASRDFDLIISAIIPASSQFLKDLAGLVLMPFRSTDYLITRSPDSKRVNPKSKGLTRFNPESTPRLKAVNPASTPGLRVSTTRWATQPRPVHPQR